VAAAYENSVIPDNLKNVLSAGRNSCGFSVFELKKTQTGLKSAIWEWSEPGKYLSLNQVPEKEEAKTCRMLRAIHGETL